MIRAKRSSRRKAGIEAYDVLLPLFASFPIHIFYAPQVSPKREGMGISSPSIVCLGSRLQVSWFLLHSCMQFRHFCSAVLQSLTALLVVLGSVTVVWNACTPRRSDWFSVFMFGLKANRYWLRFALYTCTLHVKHALSLLQTLFVAFGWPSFSYLKCQRACWNRCLLPQ